MIVNNTVLLMRKKSGHKNTIRENKLRNKKLLTRESMLLMMILWSTLL
jgi:hypothetical protein